MKSFFKKNKNLWKNIYAFTLVELVVSVAITSILFMFLFSFVVDSLNEIETSKRKTEFFSDFSSFNIKMKNFSETFPKYSKIKDFNSWSWMDILLMKNIKWNFWIAIWVVDTDSMKFAQNYEHYSEKNLWYLELDNTALTLIAWNSDKIYDYKIFRDKIFPKIYIKDFQVNLYNSSSIMDLTVELIPYYLAWLKWIAWKDIDKKEFFKLVLNY